MFHITLCNLYYTATLLHIVPHQTVPCTTLQLYCTFCHTTQHTDIPHCSCALFFTLNNTTSHCSTLHSAALHNPTPHCTSYHFVAQHHNTLHYTTLHPTLHTHTHIAPPYNVAHCTVQNYTIHCTLYHTTHTTPCIAQLNTTFHRTTLHGTMVQVAQYHACLHCTASLVLHCTVSCITTAHQVLVPHCTVPNTGPKQLLFQSAECEKSQMLSGDFDLCRMESVSGSVHSLLLCLFLYSRTMRGTTMSSMRCCLPCHRRRRKDMDSKTLPSTST